jgi:hypothetical protein
MTGERAERNWPEKASCDPGAEAVIFRVIVGADLVSVTHERSEITAKRVTADGLAAAPRAKSRS